MCVYVCMYIYIYILVTSPSFMKQYQNISCPLNALLYIKPYTCPISTTGYS